MAKQMVNPIERHVEKLVVGVAALVLVGSVALYLVSSPNKVEMGGETVTPKSIDARLAERASDVLARLRSADPEVVIPEPLADDFNASVSPLTSTKLAPTAPMVPPVPMIDPPSTKAGKATLVQVVRPEKIGVTYGRSTVDLAGEQGARYTPVNWATVSAVFDYKQQVEMQKRAYGAKWDEVRLVSPEMQRRTQRADGSWSDDDWQDIVPTPALPLPVPEINLLEARGGETMVVPAESMQKLNNFQRPFIDPKYGRDLLRPLMYPIVNGSEWKFPILTAYQDVVRQDDEFLNPDGKSSVTDLYGFDEQPQSGAAAPAVAKDPTDAALDAIKARIDQARKDREHQRAVEAFNEALGLANNTSVSPSQRQRAQKLKEEADQLEKEIQREKLIGNPKTPAPGGEQVAEVRPRLPIQQVWAHDAAVGSLQDGHTYQYRIRCRIVNALAGDPAKLNDPQDATKVVLASDWSEATEPVTFEPTSLFFATYEDRSKGEVGVEAFIWYYGVWVKSRRQKMGVGDALAFQQRIDVPGLTDPAAVESASVDFGSAGYTVIDIDMDREMLERKSTRGSEGVTFGAPKKDTAMVYIDAEGRLHERFVSLDKEHPDKREASGRLWTPKAKP